MCVCMGESKYEIEKTGSGVKAEQFKMKEGQRVDWAVESQRRLI